MVSVGGIVYRPTTRRRMIGLFVTPITFSAALIEVTEMFVETLGLTVNVLVRRFWQIWNFVKHSLSFER